MITDRIDAITHIPEEYRHQILPAPKSVKIELTARCNFSCSFCARSQRLRQQKGMDRAFFNRVTLEMRRAGVEELGLFYLGESFLCKWLPEAVKYAKDIGYPYVFLTTNGSLATRERVHAVMDAGLDSLKFSLNYADAEQLTEIARVKGSLFETILHNIEEAAEIRALHRYKCGLYASYIEYDGEQREKMQEVVGRVRPYLDEVYALPLYNQAGFVSDAEKERGWSSVAGNRGRAGALREPLPCWAVFTEGHITWDGHLSACCFDHDSRFGMGNLNDLSFMDAWNSQNFQDLRQAHLEKDVIGTVCENCVAYA